LKVFFLSFKQKEATERKRMIIYLEAIQFVSYSKMTLYLATKDFHICFFPYKRDFPLKIPQNNYEEILQRGKIRLFGVLVLGFWSMDMRILMVRI
jgi:hypothetical protein